MRNVRTIPFETRFKQQKEIKTIRRRLPMDRVVLALSFVYFSPSEVFLFRVPRALSLDRRAPDVLGPDSVLTGATTVPEDAIDVVAGAVTATTGSFFTSIFLGIVFGLSIKDREAQKVNQYKFGVKLKITKTNKSSPTFLARPLSIA